MEDLKKKAQCLNTREANIQAKNFTRMLAYSPLLKLKQVKHGWFPETDAAPRCMHCNGQREVQLCEGFTVMVLGERL